MKIRANNIDIEVVDSAPDAPHLPVVLLIMGLGMQLIAWPPGLVRACTPRRAWAIIVFCGMPG